MRNFVGKGHRRKGVVSAGLAGALELIAGLGGGVVEGYPEPAGAVSERDSSSMARSRRTSGSASSATGRSGSTAGSCGRRSSRRP